MEIQSSDVMKYESDVLVIGGGPAGSTAATLLSRQGWSVQVLEKARFPRYHIGESLMPFCYFTLERLGVLSEMEKFVKKYSVQFVNQDGKQSKPFYFFQHYDHPSSTTWQVVRSEFDNMLLDLAKKEGAQVHHDTKAGQVLYNTETGAINGVAATNEAGEALEYRAKMVIDATGRDAFLQSKMKWRERDPKLNKIAVWTYYRNAKRDPGLDAGTTTVGYLPGKGWFWFIPLPDGVTSVGIVAERDYLYRDGVRDLAEMMDREIPANAWIADHLAGAEQFGEYWVTGEYSYRSEYCATDGAVMVGDAFAFLDPVFSSGVFLALKSGEMAADAVHQALLDQNYTAEQFDNYGEALCGHIEKMRKIVYAFYDPNFSFADFIRKYPDLRGDLTDNLIGNLSGDFDDLYKGMADFAKLPPELAAGRKGQRVAEQTPVPVG
jgi:flavin-dependent dehydrogenase